MLRNQAIADMKKLNISDWSLPVILIAPDGVKYALDAETNETLKAVQILYDRKEIDPDSGEQIMVKEPVVTLALSSLSRVPKDGENWSVQFPMDPTKPDVLTTFLFTSDKAFKDGQSLGFIRIYPQKADQTVVEEGD